MWYGPPYTTTGAAARLTPWLINRPGSELHDNNVCSCRRAPPQLFVMTGGDRAYRENKYRDVDTTAIHPTITNYGSQKIEIETVTFAAEIDRFLKSHNRPNTINSHTINNCIQCFTVWKLDCYFLWTDYGQRLTLFFCEIYSVDMAHSAICDWLHFHFDIGNPTAKILPFLLGISAIYRSKLKFCSILCKIVGCSLIY